MRIRIVERVSRPVHKSVGPVHKSVGPKTRISRTVPATISISRFWEGRFKALRIRDEAGLLACAMYVDLTPIRAAITESPDKAVHTSAQDCVIVGWRRFCVIAVRHICFQLLPLLAPEISQFANGDRSRKLEQLLSFGFL